LLASILEKKDLDVKAIAKKEPENRDLGERITTKIIKVNRFNQGQDMLPLEMRNLESNSWEPLHSNNKYPRNESGAKRKGAKRISGPDLSMTFKTNAWDI